MSGKRKFGFNLTPLKIPSRADNDALRRALDGDFSPVSSPDSPFIDRQSISRSTEQELKAACKLLVERTGNAHQNSKEDAIVNLSTLQRAARHKPDTTKQHDDTGPAKALEAQHQRSHHSLHKAATAEIHRKENEEQKHALEKSAPEERSENKQRHYPVRRDSLSGKKHAELTKTSKSVAVSAPPAIAERPRTAPILSGDESCQSSPLSASTDFQPQSVSTALTSIPPTPYSKSSFKISQPPPTVPKASETSHLRITANVEETQIQPGATEHIREGSSTAPLPNDKNFMSGFKDFVRNRSRSRSRSREPSTLRRTGSTLQNWRSGWGLRRKQSTSDFGELSASVGSASSHQRQSSKPDVDLNRALPPLPSLDTYKEQSEKRTTEKTDSHIDDGEIHNVSESRPQTSVTTVQSKPQMNSAIESIDKPGSERSASANATRKHSLTVSTTIPIPSRKFSVAESRISSQDSCFSPTGTDAGTPKRSMDVMKAAAIARTQSMDITAQQAKQSQIQPLKETNPTSGAQKSSAASRHSSRPSSRGTSKAPAPARYTIIPHQRTPSQPLLYSRSHASSVVNLPPRPATRDASSTPTRSRMPSFGAQSLACSHPPLPVNFSKKIENASRPTTAGAPKTDKPPHLRSVTANEITALPLYQTKKQPGLRRMFSSISLRKPKTHDVSWMFNEVTQSPPGINAVRG